VRSKTSVSPLLPALGLIGAIAAPASAQNFFAGTTTDMPYQLVLGSAPSPKPTDMCVYGSTELHCYTDATRNERRRYIPDPKDPGHFREIRPGDEKLIDDQNRAKKQAGHEIFGLGAELSGF
jgi:hypothetical protein